MLSLSLSKGSTQCLIFRIIQVVMVRNVTEKRAHDVPHLSAKNSLQRFFSESSDEFTEKNNFLLLSAALQSWG